MVVHLEDAKATLTAVMRSYRLPCLFPCALHAILVFIILALEWGDHTLLDATRVRKGGPDMTQVSHYAKSIERDKVEEALHCERDSLYKLLVDKCLLVPVENVCSVSNVLAIDD